MTTREDPSLLVTVLGPIGVVCDGVWRPVRGSTARGLLAVLSIRGGRGASVGELSTILWEPDAPPPTSRQSLANVVMRLRRGFGAGLIESLEDGYRLGSSVATDRVQFLTEVRAAEATLAASADRAVSCAESALKTWSGEPYTGLHDKGLVADDLYTLQAAAGRARRTLALGLAACGRLDDAAVAITEHLRDEPFDDVAWSWLIRILDESGRRVDARRALRRWRSVLREAGLEPSDDFEQLNRTLSRRQSSERSRSATTSDARRLLSTGIQHWTAGRPEEAIGTLEPCADWLPPDDLRRYARCLSVLSPHDGFARGRWREIMGLPEDMSGRIERVIVSLDAYALEHHADGLAIAEREAEAAAGTDGWLRALRVHFMAGLVRSNCADQNSVLRRLARIDHPEALIESCRFGAILAARRGEFDAVVEMLEEYSKLVAEHRPDWLDDFAELTKVVLDQCGHLPSGAEHPGSSSLIPVLHNLYTVDVVETWRAIALQPGDEPSLLAARTERIAGTLPSRTADAMRLLTATRTAQEEDSRRLAAAVEADETVDRQRPHRYWQLVPLALAEHALASGDPELGTRVATSLRPWRGEYLGLWPLDLVAQPADAVLDRLAEAGAEVSR